MERALGRPDVEWSRESLRRSAILASEATRRRIWVAVLAFGSSLLFGLGLLLAPGRLGLAMPGLDALRPLVEQTRGLSPGQVSPERLQTLGHPLWVLLGRLTADLAPVAFVMAAVAAIVSLFLVYHLCHALADPSRADEQACFALLGLALTPSFFMAAAGGGTELPHLALVLGALLCVQRALVADRPFVTLSFAGLLFGLSLLIRPISLLVPPAVLIWLLTARPFGREEWGEMLKPALGFFAAFAVGAAPTLLVHLTLHTRPVSWGPAELGMLWARLLTDPLHFLLGIGQSILQYVGADDLERLGGVGGTWGAGDWLSLPGTMMALAPSILKLLSLAGLLSVLWLERFEATVERARLPVVLLGFFIVGGALGLVEERSLLVLSALLVVFAFAGLPSLLPGSISGVLGVLMIGFLLIHQFSGAQVARQSAAFKASDLVTTALHAAGATPDRVMSASWMFYDTQSPWRSRYLPVPAHVNSREELIREMQRRGVRFLVFDRQGGADRWPRLADLLDSDQPRPGLRAVTPPLTTPGSPPNTVAIYSLE